MSLKRKTWIIIGLIVLCGTIFFNFVARSILSKTIDRLETREVNKNVQTTVNVLNNETRKLNGIVADYANWNDTYYFVKYPNSEYLTENFGPAFFISQGIDFVLIIDSSNQPVFVKRYDRVQNKEIPANPALTNLIGNNCMLIPKDLKGTNGVYVLPEGPIILSAHSILTSEFRGPTRGVLIMGLYLDKNQLKKVDNITRQKTALYRYDSDKLTNIRQQLSQSKVSTLVRPLNDNLVAGYFILRDVENKPALILEVYIPRELHAMGKTFMDNAIRISLALILAIGLIIILPVNRLIIKRIMNLNHSVNLIGTSGGIDHRVPEEGRDEISSLARSINEMLQALEQSQHNLKNQLSYLNTLLDNLNELFLTCDNHGYVTMINRRSNEFLGFDSTELIGTHIFNLLPTLNREKIVQDIGRKWLRDKVLESMEIEIQRKNGTAMWGRVNASPIIIDGEQKGIVILIEDFTAHKEAEDNLRYLGTHDSLTHVFNRTYYEQVITNLHNRTLDRVGLIVCDIDGLKMVNDMLGHDIGDQLLIETSQLLNQSIGDTGMLFRVGGDEFAVVLPDCSQTELDNICNLIRTGFTGFHWSLTQASLSISIGSALWIKGIDDIADVIRIADNNMYREKLYSSRSSRASIVAALTKAMEARDFATEGHADRLQDLVVKLGKKIGLPVNRLTELKLLARFHDIGKVGIPDRILLKPGRLTPGETVEMQFHCVIGQRIAQAVPELVPIADWILKHHEWWNGGGYPTGLKGQDIPLECRILAIADAYDAMTSDRPYRPAMSRKDALEELERCAGTQFDPVLVGHFIEIDQDTS